MKGLNAPIYTRILPSAVAVLLLEFSNSYGRSYKWLFLFHHLSQGSFKKGDKLISHGLTGHFTY